MADRVTVVIEGEEYSITPEQKTAWDELVAAHFAPIQALLIVTEDFQDIDPPITPEAQP